MPAVQNITRPDGSALAVLAPAPGAPATDNAQALGLAGPRPVVWVAGDADALPEAMRPRLTQLLARGLLRPLREPGGTAAPLLMVRAAGAGLPALLGRCVADGGGVRLLGIAPQALVDPSGSGEAGGAGAAPASPPVPGLTDLMLTAGQAWGDELRDAMALAAAVAAGPRALLLLICGDAGTLPQVLAAVRQGWPVLLVKGSGGLADALVSQAERGSAAGDDPTVAEILADGRLGWITLGDSVAAAVEALARRVRRNTGGDSVLRQAWQRFAVFDQAAARQQKGFNTMQRWILALGVAVVALSVGRKQWLGLLAERAQGAAGRLADAVASAAGAASAASWPASGPASGPAMGHASAGLADDLMFVLLVGLPITVSALVALDIRLSPGKRWLLLRAAAEGIKREIYRYRALPAAAGEAGAADKALALAVEDITRRLARTEVNTLALPPYQGQVPPPGAVAPGDDGLSPMGPDRYLRLRLREQCEWYRRKTVSFHFKATGCQVAVIVVGAAGSLFTALSGRFMEGLADWVAVTAAISSALLAYLGYKQFEKTVVGYNQTATDLENLTAWWTALSPDEQTQPDNVTQLVTHTEKALADEQGSWAQSMTNALEDLRKSQTAAPAKRQGQDGGDGDGDGGDGANGGKPPAPDQEPDADRNPGN